MECEERTGECRGAIKAGMVAIGRAGLGYFPTIQIHKAKGKQRRNIIQDEVSVEEERRGMIVGLSRQGAWTRWENLVKRTINRLDIWHADASRLKFLVQLVYDVLPSPANSFTWGKSRIPSCPLCAGKGTLKHIMSDCPRALGDGRYRWRHDQVLRTVANAVDAAICANNYKPEARLIYSVKAGECPPLRVKSKLCAERFFTAVTPAGTIVSVGSLGRASMKLEDPKLVRTPRTSLTRRFWALC